MQFKPPLPLEETHPMPSVQPPRTRMRYSNRIALWFFVILASAAVLIASGIVYAGQHSTPPSTHDIPSSNLHQLNAAASATASDNATATANTIFEETASAQVTPVPMTPVPSPAPQNDLGVSQTSGVWTITVNSIRPVVSTNEFEVPKPGNQFVLINFTAKNTDSAAHDMNPFYFTLRDGQGNSYDVTGLTVARNPDGTVVGGQQLRGDLAYELPKTLHSLVLQFDSPDDLDNSQVVQWQLSV